MSRKFRNLVKYDFILFFREPIYAALILIMPVLSLFFVMSMLKSQNGSLAGLDQLIPVFGLLIAFMTVFFNMGINFVIEKENGVHKRLVLSAITKKHIVGAHVVKGVIISFIGLVEMMLVGVFGFGLTLTEHLFVFLVSYILILGLIVLLSVTIYDFFKTMNQALAFSMTMMMYVVMCSGTFFPLKNFPDMLKNVVYSNPFYHMNEIVIKTWSGQFDNISLWSVGYLVALTIVALLIVGYNSLKREA